MSNQLILGENKSLITNPLKNRIFKGLLAEIGQTLTKKYQVLEWELNEPDYQWLCYFADKMCWEVEKTMELIIKNGIMINKNGIKLKNNSFVELDVSNLYAEMGFRGYEIHKINGKINFYGLKELKFLQCSFNNLSELDVSNNPKLEYLFCGKNNLAELSISNNFNLDQLICDSNNLVELDLSNNGKLKSLFCRNNKLKSLNLSNNIGLEELNCSANNLTEIDISKNNNLVLTKPEYLGGPSCSFGNIKKIFINQQQKEDLEENSEDMIELDDDVEIVLVE